MFFSPVLNNFSSIITLIPLFKQLFHLFSYKILYLFPHVFIKANESNEKIWYNKEKQLKDWRGIFMRKKIIFIILAFILAPILLFQKTTIADQTVTSIMSDWGHILKNSYENDNKEVFAKGDNYTILKFDIEQAIQFYLLNGLTKENAKKEAVKYTLEREVLYQAAVENGFTATKEEIYDYLYKLKNTIETSNNKDDAEAVIAQFDTPEDYWNFEYLVYEKNIPIEKYRKELEKEYKKSQTHKKESWDEYFQQVKDDLVKKENFQIIK